MVRVIMEDKVENIPLDKMNGMDAKDVIEACGKDNSWYVTVAGRRIDESCSLSTLSLIDRSSIRIVKEPTDIHPLPDDFESKLKTVNDHMKKIVGSNSRTFIISDYMTDSDKMDVIRRKFPQIYLDAHVWTVCNDFYSLQAFFSESTPEKEALIRRHPYILDLCICLVQNTMSKSRNMMAPPRAIPPPAAPVPAPAPLFTANSITAAIEAASRAAGVAAPPPVVPPVQNDLLQQYRSQLIQLREFGFTDDEMNIHVLVESNGAIDGAIELLIAMRESMEQ
ncbi:hypothetical protein PENTCL1PPCAC_22840 [Pristionchus entomophagus]|uniref:UBA domain-containing protein n=1 Tax=Pristionchus entomophagus TaxID=358040 RepID=A0AAV5U2F0_9BILA|nr:hypothetical protein PENTCL1PPCAC_22840 [Pristionchus entomophagus]